MSVLFCNIGWMERYQGLSTRDQIFGGGSYVDQNRMGYEVCNFAPSNKTLYGYVQPAGQQINIDRLGANREDESIADVTVIWTARHRTSGSTVVIGWYKGATVFRNYQKFSRAPDRHRNNGINGYWIKAPSDQAKLLPIDERTHEIPKGIKGGMGQSNVWYADNPESEHIVKETLEFVNGKRGKVPATKRRRQDQQRKAQIEKEAIRLCCNHFEKIGYTVKSVEKDNVGWDLEATSRRMTLRVEVKGLSANTFFVELTPNEYEAFSKESADYRLAVVLNALESPELFICRYSREQKAWVVDEMENKSVQVEIKRSAVVKCM